MIFHWSDETLDLETRVKLKGLARGGKRPFAVTVTFTELKHLMVDPLYLHEVTYALAMEPPPNYKELIQR